MACGTLFLHLALLVVTVRADSFPCGVVRSRPRARISGGTAAQPHAYPWTVKLVQNDKLKCGGSIISPEYIITAAHCIKNTEPSDVLEIVAGAHKYEHESESVQKIRVSKKTSHQKYNKRSFMNDIAVLKLSQNLTYTSHVSPICLPEMDDTLPSRCIVAGWGRTRCKVLGASPEELQEVSLTAYAPSTCRTRFGPSISKLNKTVILDQGVMCTADPGPGPCKGTSGGPLFCLLRDGTGGTAAYYLFGVVSMARVSVNGGSPNVRLPTFYAYVPYFSKWIKSNEGDGRVSIPGAMSPSNASNFKKKPCTHLLFTFFSFHPSCPDNAGTNP